MAQPKLEINDKYTYNDETKQYVFHTESLIGKNTVFKEDKVNTILKLYSNYDKQPYTMGEIAQRTSTPKKVIDYIIHALKKNHSCLPFTDEKLIEQPEDKLVDQMLAEKTFNVIQKFERKEWESVAKDAEKWREFSVLKLDPFANFLANWTPKIQKPFTNFNKLHTNKKGKHLLLGCSDWHFGLVADERYLYNQQQWDITKTKEAVEKYSLKIREYLADHKGEFESVSLLFAGDLIHGLDGYTDKGTKLEAHPLKEGQLVTAFDCIIQFITDIVESHSNVKVYSVPGNHSSFGDYIVIKMADIYFKDDDRIQFEYTNKRFLTFKLKDNYFLFEHGYAAVAKDRLPAPGKSREGYINNIIFAKPEKIQGAKRFYYISADQHHHESYEYTNVEGVMLPTLVGGCRHSDNSGYKSRPRQTVLIVEDEGITEMKHFFLD